MTRQRARGAAAILLWCSLMPVLPASATITRAPMPPRLPSAVVTAAGVPKDRVLDSEMLRAAGPPTAGDPGSAQPLGSGAKASNVVALVDGDTAATAMAAVAGAGGVIEEVAGSTVQARVPTARLRAVAATPGILAVRAPREVRPNVTSEGVHDSGADVWQSAVPVPHRGTGVKIGILDTGFAGYQSLPSNELTVAAAPYVSPNCSLNSTDHGTAVAETVYDMAPGASIYLLCVRYESEMAGVANYVATQGIKILNASIGVIGSTRLDGSGGPATMAGAVAAMRQQGVLTVASAGNYGTAHYGFVPFHQNGAGLVEVPGTPVGKYRFSAQGSGTVTLTWDNWYPAKDDFDLEIYKIVNGTAVFYAASTTFQSGGATQVPAEFVDVTSPGGGTPVQFEVVIRNAFGSANFNRRFDLYLDGSLVAVDPVTAAGSLPSPASSPAALAVGAYCGTAPFTHPFESYSSQGPTIDRRPKPDLSGPDGTATVTYGTAPNCGAVSSPNGGGFFGTSASAPHVAGAAALLAEANPTLDPIELQDRLQRLAVDAGSPGFDNRFGWGRLAMGPVAVPASTTGNLYAGLATPVRLLNTTMGPATTKVVAVTTQGVPSDATAVVLNVAAARPSAAGYLTLWPVGEARPSASTLNFAATQTIANGATVAVGSAGQVSLYNSAGTTRVVLDLVGYYGPTGATGGMFPLASPRRLTDTRPGRCPPGGSHCGTPLAGASTTDFPIGGVAINGGTVPISATAVVVNLVAVQPGGDGYLTAWPGGAAQPGTSSLNFAEGSITANLVTVGLGGPSRTLRLFTTHTTDVVMDLLGYYDAGGARYVPLRVPERTLDTRYGNGAKNLPAAARVPLTVQVRGIHGVPLAATAVLLNGVVVGPSAAGILTIDRNVGSTVAATSNLNFVAGQTLANSVLTTFAASPTGTVRFYSSTASGLVADIVGYFR